MFQMRSLLVAIVTALSLISCARVGSPVGGDKDTIPPKVLGSNIDSTRVNVPTSLKELRIDFDEYVTLKEATKNLNISPPIKKLKKILPANLATKFVLIQWEDDLQENTTYNFNFGNAIQDNNENNPLPYYNFAFSTGEKIDDIYISGEVQDRSRILPPTSPKNRVVGLYKYSDSINYSQKPYYLTRADDDGYYELDYLAPGTYRIIAFEDDNGNSVYEPGREKIAFLRDSIQLDKSVSGLNLDLFPSKKQVRYLETKPETGGLLMLFEGNPAKVTLESRSEKLKDYRVTHRQNSDSVRIWFNAEPQNIGTEATERLEFGYNADGKTGTATAFYRKPENTEMTIANNAGNLVPPRSPFIFTSNYQVDKIQPANWTLNEDSLTAVVFDARISQTNPMQVLVNADFKEGKKYQLTVPRQTVSSFYNATEKTYRFEFEGDKIENYGSFEITLKNRPSGKFWLQLLDSGENVQYQKYTSDEVIKFPFLKAGVYLVRILADNNGNGNWDVSDLSSGTFAEDAYVFYKGINVRPLWEIREEWDLTDTRKLDPATIPKPEVKAPVEEEPDELPNPDINSGNSAIRDLTVPRR